MKQEITLLKDKEWSVIDGEPCKVIDFTPWGFVKDRKISTLSKMTPYASITIECKKYPQEIKGFITHKIDFINLWSAFKERTLKQDEEVIIFWSKKHYKNIIYKIFSAFMPRLWVMICQEGTFELITDPNHKPELTGEARFKATLPIIEWKPEVMK